MAISKLHIICGNCGCNEEFSFKIDLEGHDYSNEVIDDKRPAVFVKCDNCSTIHDLSDFIKEQNND